MGMYNYALIEVTFPNHVIFGDKSQLEEYIEDKKSMIKYCKQKLHAMVLMTEPKKFIGDDYDPLIWLNNEFEEIMEELEDNIYWLGFAEKLLDAWDKIHDENGRVKYNPLVHDRLDESQYIQGDCIEYNTNNTDLELSDKDYNDVYKDARKRIDKQNKTPQDINCIDLEKFVEWCKENGKDPGDDQSKLDYVGCMND